MEKCFEINDLRAIKNQRLLKNFKGLIFDVDDKMKHLYLEKGKEIPAAILSEAHDLPEYFENEENIFEEKK